MLFHSSLRKELARSFGATLVVLVTIVMSMILIRTLGQATKGSVNPQEVMLVMGYTVLGYMPTILTLSLFIAIVSTLSRMYKDSEMVIWFASGRGLASFLSPLLRFAWPVLAVIAAFALLIWPWANQQTAELRERYERRGDLDRVAPGQFQTSASGSRVFFIDKDAASTGGSKNVFISTSENGKDTVTSAQSGRIEIVGNDQMLRLSSGQRLETTVATGEIQISEFADYSTRVGTSRLSLPGELPVRARSTQTLLVERTAPHLGELAWRLGLALAAFNCVVIALVLSSVNPRVGRAGGMVFALFTFIVYYNLINLGQSWVTGGRASFAGFMLGLHGGGLLLGLLWLAKRHNNWTLRSLLRPRTRVSTE